MNYLIKILLILISCGFGHMHAQNLKQHFIYEGLNYSFVQIVEGPKGNYFVSALNQDTTQYRLFVLNQNLEIEHIDTTIYNGPIDVAVKDDTPYIAMFDNGANQLILSAIDYDNEEIQLTEIARKYHVDTFYDGSTTYFGALDFEWIHGHAYGLIANESRPNKDTYFFKFEDSLSISTAYHLLFDRDSFKINFAYDFYFSDADSAIIVRHNNNISKLNLDFQVVDPVFNPETPFYQQGSVLRHPNGYFEQYYIKTRPFTLFETMTQVRFLDDSLNVLRVDTIGPSDFEKLGIPPVFGGLQVNASQDTFYALGSQGLHYFFKEGAGDTTSRCFLRAYGTDMNKLWDMTLGDSLVHIGPYKLEIMDNGHLMIIGSQAGPESNYIFYPFIIEIDPYGRMINSSNPVPFQSNSVRLYPNPANDRIHLKFLGDETTQKLDIQIIDIHGRLYKEVKGVSSDQAITISNLPSGRYFLRCISENHIVAVKSLIKIE